MITSAFVAYAVNQAGINIWIALIFGGAFGAVASLVLNRAVFSPFIRRGTRLFGMVVVTLATGLIIENALLAFVGPNYFSYRLPPGGGDPRGGPRAHDGAVDCRRDYRSPQC